MNDSFESKMRKILKTTEAMKTPSCLEDETIGLYIEGKLSGEEKERAEKHISSCLYCMDQLLELRELIYYQNHPAPIPRRLFKKIRSLYSEGPTPVRPPITDLLGRFIQEASTFFNFPARRWQYATVAAASVIIVLGILTLWKPLEKSSIIAKKDEIKTGIPATGERPAGEGKSGIKTKIAREYSPLSSIEFGTAIAKNTDIKSLSDSIKLDQGTVYGFSGGISPGKTSFRMGVYLMDLQISSRAGEKEKLSDLVRKILVLLKTMGQAATDNITPDQISETVEKLDSFRKDRDLFLYLRFGEWVEAGRLASIARYKDFFGMEGEPINYFIKNLEGKDLPQGVLAGLQSIKEIATQKEIPEREFRQLETAFSDILGMM